MQLEKHGGDKKFKPSDLEIVAVIENFVLCSMVQQVREGGMDKDSMLKVYDISEEEFERANNSYEKYKSIGIMKLYNDMYKRNKGELPKKAIHYTAGTLELRPAEARKSLVAMGLLEGNLKRESFEGEYRVVYNVSQMIIDNIMRDPELTPEEKNMKICEIEVEESKRVLANVEEANRKQDTDRYKIAREDEAREIG